jgi:hypothetical protein
MEGGQGMSELNDPIATDGDIGFMGFASRPDPLVLPAGMASLARNKRFMRGRAETRKGIKRLADDIAAGEAPLTLPFALAASQAVTSLTAAAGVATATVPGHGFTTGQRVEMRGADQAEYNGDFGVNVTDADSFTYPVAGGPASPATGTITANGGPVVRTNYDGGLHSAIIFRSPVFDAGKEWIAMAGMTGLWLWREGQAAQEVAYPAGEQIASTDRVSMLQAFDALYIFREAAWAGIYFPKTVGGITRSGTTATVTLTAHGFSTGQRIRIEGAAQAGYNHEFDITVTGPDAFTFTVAHDPATPATGTMKARAVKPPLYWDGVASAMVRNPGGSHAAGPTYHTMPSASVVKYFNNQIIVCPTPTRDQVLVSDVLDDDTYDPLLKSFRPNAGSSDFIVALHPYAESDILILMRNSLYRARIVVAANGTDIDVAESFIELLTDEIGCSARDSVVTAGQFIYFLSDAGVYRLDSNFSDLKLRGGKIPLSDGIADQFDDLNASAVHTANAVWYDNRYWLVVPRVRSDFPNRMFVFNSLNDAWESVDDFPTAIHSLVVGTYQSRRRLFGVTRQGRIFLMDENDMGDDPNYADVPGQLAIPGELITRRYAFGVPLPKRFLRVVAGVDLRPDSEVETLVQIFEPDKELILGSLENEQAEAEDYALKYSIRSRGTSAQVRMRDVRGRSTIRTVAVEAVMSAPRTITRTQT